jgi:vacuolar-type H+-ATPase subunit H
LILKYFYLTIAPNYYGQRDQFGEERSVNEKSIQQVLDIEKKAQEIQEQAQREAQELPRLAEQEAQALIAQAKAEAQEEARKIIAEAQAEDKAKEILAEVERQNSELEAKANANLDKAVNFVLERVLGRG